MITSPYLQIYSIAFLKQRRTEEHSGVTPVPWLLTVLRAHRGQSPAPARLPPPRAPGPWDPLSLPNTPRLSPMRPGRQRAPSGACDFQFLSPSPGLTS